MLDSQVLAARIEAAYLSSGCTLGWRFLYGPKQTLSEAEVVFLGLNPGGSLHEPNSFSVEGGSAYSVENWGGTGKNPLQKQVLALFEALGLLSEAVLAGNLVPWRSKDWKSLSNKSQAIAFASVLWREILLALRPKLVICMGGEATKIAEKLLRAREVERVDIGWGKIQARRLEWADGELVGLPHLSRYKIVTRPQSQAGLQRVFGRHWKA